MVAATSENLEWIRSIHLFARLSDEVLSGFLQQMQERPFEAGEVLTQAGSSCEGVCLVRRGRVSLLYPVGEAEEDGEAPPMMVVGRLAGGDYYSEECTLDEDYPEHIYTAQAETDGVLYCWPLEDVTAAIAEHPSMAVALHLVKDSRRRARRRRPKWLPPDEIVYLLLGRPLVALLPRLKWAAVLALIAAGMFLRGMLGGPDALLWGSLGVALVALALAVWEYIDWSNDYCVVTNRRVAWVDKVLLLYESRNEAGWPAVIASTQRTGWWGRLLGYGDVIVRTYAGEILFKEVSSPEVIVRFIEEYSQRARSEIEQRSKAQLLSEIKRELGLAPHEVSPASPPASPATSQKQTAGWLLRLWRLLQQRVEENGVVTYRKHWFLLLRRSWLPFLSVLGWAGLAFYLAFSRRVPVTWQTVLAALVVEAVLLFWLGWQVVDWRNDYYQITPKNIVDVYRKPFGTEEKQSAPLESVENLQHRRVGLLGWLLNFGDVEIRVGTTVMTFQGVARPDMVQQDIFRRVQKRREERAEAERRQEREQWLRWMKIYHEVVHEDGAAEGESGV